MPTLCCRRFDSCSATRTWPACFCASVYVSLYALLPSSCLLVRGLCVRCVRSGRRLRLPCVTICCRPCCRCWPRAHSGGRPNAPPTHSRHWPSSPTSPRRITYWPPRPCSPMSAAESRALAAAEGEINRDPLVQRIALAATTSLRAVCRRRGCGGAAPDSTAGWQPPLLRNSYWSIGW